MLGVKIPANDGNNTLDGRSLPMDYQISLGTLDLIVGMNYDIIKINFVIALQQPLTQNKNRFLAEAYPTTSFFRKFHSTNNFKRSGDILFRISYPIQISDKMNLTPNLLPIYHLSDDQFTNSDGIESKITGSKGLTVNSNLMCSYTFNNQNTLVLNYGMPVINREVIPDGMKRSYVISIEYRIKFKFFLFY